MCMTLYIICIVFKVWKRLYTEQCYLWQVRVVNRLFKSFTLYRSFMSELVTKSVINFRTLKERFILQGYISPHSIWQKDHMHLYPLSPKTLLEL